MGSTLKKICNFIVISIIVIIVIYITFFTEIPKKTGNLVR